MASVKSIVDSVVLKEDSDLSFVTHLRGNRSIDFNDYADTLIKLGVIRSRFGGKDPTIDLALSGDILNDPKVSQPYYDVENAVATVRWKLHLDTAEYGLKGVHVEILDVSFSADFILFEMDTDEETLTKISVPSAKEQGFELETQVPLISIPHKPKTVEVNYHDKRIHIEF